MKKIAMSKTRKSAAKTILSLLLVVIMSVGAFTPSFQIMAETNASDRSADSASVAAQADDVKPFSIIHPSETTYTFIFMDGTEEVERQQITNGDTLFEPKAPEKPQKRFTGWYAEGEATPYNFGTITVPEDASD